jgi:hypothetical protein
MTKLEIKQGHIMRGLPGDASQCAIALAAMEAFPGYKAAASLLSVLLFRLDDTPFIRAGMPKAGKQFIRLFDLGQKVEPLTLELEFFACETAHGPGTPVELP